MNMKSKHLYCIAILLLLSGASIKKFGYLVYKEAKREQLVAAGTYPDGRKKYLLKEANTAFKKMVSKARKEKVQLVLISAFRSVKYQEYLFNRAAKKYGSKKEAARYVAPPGCSEHHTGCAVDIGDADDPGANLSVRFEKTEAFKWLKKNAGKYGFTLSFPRDNSQGVSYEPWHWRFKGSIQKSGVRSQKGKRQEQE